MVWVNAQRERLFFEQRLLSARNNGYSVLRLRPSAHDLRVVASR